MCEAAELLPEIVHHIHTNTHISEILKLKATGSEYDVGGGALLRFPSSAALEDPLAGVPAHAGQPCIFTQQALLLSGLSLLKGLCHFSFMLFSFGFYGCLLPRESLLSLGGVSGSPLCCVLPPQAA